MLKAYRLKAPIILNGIEYQPNIFTYLIEIKNLLYLNGTQQLRTGCPLAGGKLIWVRSSGGDQ